MIEEKARVTAIENGYAVIEVQRISGCQTCELKGGCGTGSLGRLLGFKQKPFIIKNDLDLTAGDQVVLALAEKSFVLAGLLVYLLPLMGLFLCAVVADTLIGAGDGLTVVAALLGLAAGLLLSSWLSRHALTNDMQPKVVRQIW